MEKHIAATALLAAAVLGSSQQFYSGFHAGGKVHQLFDFTSIVRARKRSQRNKSQRRRRGGHLR